MGSSDEGTTLMNLNKRRFVTAAAVTAACLLYLLFVTVSISNFTGDIFMAFPIAKESARPGLYSPHDLLVSSGIRGPYHLYKLAGQLYELTAHVDAVWFTLTVLFVWLTLLAVWYISYTVSSSRIIASIVVFLFTAASPWAGTLN